MRAKCNDDLSTVNFSTIGLDVHKNRLVAWGVSGFLCLGRLFQGQPNEAALCFL